MGAPAQPSTGTAKASRDSFGEAILRLGETHPELVVLDADLSESTRSGKFAKKYPQRFFQMGIAEADMIGAAAGLALSGKIPFCLLVRGVHHRALRSDPHVDLLLGRERAPGRQPRRRRHR